MNKDNGGSAFPLPLGSGDMSEPSESGGMTLRDYFAAKAMELGWKVFDEGHSPDPVTTKNIAAFAYQMADAMLKERKK